MSVWGFIPHTSWTFRAVEIGMLVDAALPALALAYQLRVGQEETLLAERLAQPDPLTGLNNRRALPGKRLATARWMRWWRPLMSAFSSPGNMAEIG